MNYEIIRYQVEASEFKFSHSNWRAKSRVRDGIDFLSIRQVTFKVSRVAILSVSLGRSNRNIDDVMSGCAYSFAPCTPKQAQDLTIG